MINTCPQCTYEHNTGELICKECGYEFEEESYRLDTQSSAVQSSTPLNVFLDKQGTSLFLTDCES